jgi:hypothetical protein
VIGRADDQMARIQFNVAIIYIPCLYFRDHISCISV